MSPSKDPHGRVTFSVYARFRKQRLVLSRRIHSRDEALEIARRFRLGRLHDPDAVFVVDDTTGSVVEDIAAPEPEEAPGPEPEPIVATSDAVERPAGSPSRGPGYAPLEHPEFAFHRVVEGIEDYAIFMLDPWGRVTSWNRGAERIKGYRRAEIVGQHFSLFYPPEDIRDGKPNRELVQAAADGRFEAISWRIRDDGSRFLAHVVITAVRDNDQKLIGFSKVTRDIAELNPRADGERARMRATLNAPEPVAPTVAAVPGSSRSG
jgi:PAS domain S-box-containing protein